MYSKDNHCLVCGRAHEITQCQELIDKPVWQRWKLLTQKGICTNCCKYKNHKAVSCRLPAQCRVERCSQKHHTLLHRKEEQSPIIYSSTKIKLPQRGQKALLSNHTDHIISRMCGNKNICLVGSSVSNKSYC